MARRDPVADIIAFNSPLLAPERRVPADEGGRDLTADALGRKLEALAANSFSFFRGTFHVMAADVLRGRVAHAAALAPEGLIVGDLHLDNFGAYRGSSGELVFDVNDFDDVGFGPLDFDVKRLCTSALLVPGLSAMARLETAQAVARSWADGLARLGGRFPVRAYGGDKAEEPVKALLAEHGKRAAAALLEKLAPEKGHKRFGPGGDPARAVRPAEPFRKLVEEAVLDYRRSLEQLKADLHGKTWDLLDVVYRFKGTGSLGRLRFQALLGQGDERLVVEIKEARPSALDEARGKPAAGERGRMQAASIRRLQGDPWPYVAGMHLGKLSALARSIQPEEEKVASADLAAAHKLTDYARQCGEVLARLHVRESEPLIFSADWKIDDAAAGAVEFAQAYAKVVESDYDAYRAARSDIAKKIGL
jgi:hypothetical protein